MDFEAIRPILAGLVGGLVAVGLAFAARRKEPAITGDGSVLLRYGERLRVLSWSTFVVFAFFTIYNARGGNVVNSYLVAVSVPAVLAALGGYLAIETTLVSVVLDSNHIYCRSPWRSDRKVPWRDVIEASSSITDSGLVLQTGHHGAIRLSSYLVGLDAIWSYLEANDLAFRDSHHHLTRSTFCALNATAIVAAQLKRKPVRQWVEHIESGAQRRVLRGRAREAINWRYAVGEVVLIVVGILLALAVSEWQADRVERRTELTLLRDLHTGLSADRAAAQELLERYSRIAGQLTPLLDHLRERDSYADSLAAHLVPPTGSGPSISTGPRTSRLSPRASTCSRTRKSGQRSHTAIFASTRRRSLSTMPHFWRTPSSTTSWTTAYKSCSRTISLLSRS